MAEWRSLGSMVLRLAWDDASENSDFFFFGVGGAQASKRFKAILVILMCSQDSSLWL